MSDLGAFGFETVGTPGRPTYTQRTQFACMMKAVIPERAGQYASSQVVDLMQDRAHALRDIPFRDAFSEERSPLDLSVLLMPADVRAPLAERDAQFASTIGSYVDTLPYMRGTPQLVVNMGLISKQEVMDATRARHTTGTDWYQNLLRQNVNGLGAGWTLCMHYPFKDDSLGVDAIPLYARRAHMGAQQQDVAQTVDLLSLCFDDQQATKAILPEQSLEQTTANALAHFRTSKPGNDYICIGEYPQRKSTVDRPQDSGFGQSGSFIELIARLLSTRL